MLIITKIKGRFRERFSEWVLAIGTIVWGILALLNPAVFDQKYYYVLSLLLSYPYWGIFAMTVGIARTVALYVNGVWRSTAHIRIATAVGSTFIWTSMLMASLGGDSARPLGVAIFAMLLALDMGAIWWAAEDARVADDVHNRIKRETNGS